MGDRQSRKILVVEDEWLIRMEIADAFEALDFTVIECASAEHAIEHFRADRMISLLVTDIRLAGAGSGWDLALEARAIVPEIPVIYLSANPPATHLIVEGGMFIDKPARMDKVTAAALILLDDER